MNPGLSLDRGYKNWHRYGYDNVNNITRDTLYAAGQEINGRPSNSDYSITSINYDSQNRLLPVEWFVLFHGTNRYDALGNYAFNDSIPYPYDTTGINFLQTNKVWMFMGMNYSKNVYRFTFDDSNPYFSNFNNCKLPTYFNLNAFKDNGSGYLGQNVYVSTFWGSFFDQSWLEMNIEYECSCDCGSAGAKVKS